MPLVELFRAIFKRRPYGLHILIAVQLYVYASVAFAWEEQSVRYLYMLKTFEGFDAIDYSRYYSFTCSGCFKYTDYLHILRLLKSRNLFFSVFLKVIFKTFYEMLYEYILSTLSHLFEKKSLLPLVHLWSCQF